MGTYLSEDLLKGQHMRIQRVEPYLTFAMSISLFSGCSLGMVMMSFPLAFDRWAVDASGRTCWRNRLPMVSTKFNQVITAGFNQVINVRLR